MKRYIFLAAVVALATVACTKSYEVGKTSPGTQIAFGTWSDVMTKAAKTAFADGDEFDVFGFKWKTGPSDQTTVFNGDDVAYDGTSWSYTPLRYWDSNFDNYTFFAVWPKDILATAPPQTGLFVTNARTFDGDAEPLLIAQQKDVAKANYGQVVPLVFKHMSSLVDVKFKKHSNIADAVVAVTDIEFENIQKTGTFTVNSYDSSLNPVGTVGTNGWTASETPGTGVYDESNGAAGVTLPVSLAAGTGTDSASAGLLLNNLVLMPQTFTTGANAQVLKITYTITTGSGATEQTVTFTDKIIEVGQFDKGDNTANDASDTFIAKWEPGYHYTYYITINANAIEFSATIDDWAVADNGFYYLFN